MPTIKATNQIDVVDLTDGYSVLLSQESATVPGDKDGRALALANAFSVTVTALCGSERLACTVTPTCPAGVTAGTQTTSDLAVTIPFSVTTALSGAAVVSLAVTITAAGVTVMKTVGVAVARTGGDGQSYYTYVRYSANADGSDMVASPTDDTKYIGVYSGTSATVPGHGSFTWSKYMGDDGDDGIVLTIESSAGTIFKNTQAATTLTARVFQGGAELTAQQIAQLGTVRWYKDGGSTAVGTGTTFGISAGDVTNKATYVAQLEE